MSARERIERRSVGPIMSRIFHFGAERPGRHGATPDGSSGEFHHTAGLTREFRCGSRLADQSITPGYLGIDQRHPPAFHSGVSAHLGEYGQLLIGHESGDFCSSALASASHSSAIFSKRPPHLVVERQITSKPSGALRLHPKLRRWRFFL